MEMAQVISEFKPVAGISMRAQIEKYLRELIADGRLPAGTKLPPTLGLANAWGTHAPTIHSAMVALVKDGLVERRKQRGTFVRAGTGELRNVALYVPGDRCRHNNFIEGLMHALEAEFALHGVRTGRWINRQTDQSPDQEWQPFIQAARRREFQGGVLLAVDPREVAWLAKMPVPLAALCLEPVPNRAWPRIDAALGQAMQHLAAQGCRHVGLISANSAPTPVKKGEKSPSVEFHETFRRLAGEHGLQLQERWILSPPEEVPEKAAAQFGFESFHRLWDQRERPDALVVFTDVVAQGVLMALAQRQVRVPEDLRLVLHRNKELGLFCLVPASFMDVSVHQMAAVLVDLLQRASRGQGVPHPVDVSAAFVPEQPVVRRAAAATTALIA